MHAYNSFKYFTDHLGEQDISMPVLFIGHGNPMNAIEENEFSQGWKKIVKELPLPKAILMISAHWETKGTLVTAMKKPSTIHDFRGFPQALFDVQYPAPGSSWLAEETKKTIQSIEVGMDFSWGFDHGNWSILKNLYPDASIPVIQLSLDYMQGPEYHYNLAKELQSFRKKGILIIGSGNMVHNFQHLELKGDFNTHFGHDWAIEANETFKKLITKNDFKSLINYRNYSKALQLSAPTPEHYLPLLYSMALRNEDDPISFFNDALLAGSFSMTSVKIG
ncbi:MAG: 4,5-DOPA dioxygenase extradiol [Flavobacteriia bacterium]|nr:4,5-DOPA dioxygenase extradiol [Flavobacteriia bacterium]